MKRKQKTKEIKMKKLLFAFVMFIVVFATMDVFADPQSDTTSNVINTPESSDGLQIGSATTSKLGFYGSTPIVQRGDASQVAITNSASGSISDTFAAGLGYETVSFSASLTAISDGDVLTDFVPGYKFRIVSTKFITTDPVTTGSKATSIHVEIGASPVLGGTLSLTSAGSDTLGEITAGTGISVAATGSSTATVSLVASSTTAFVEGQGVIQIILQNLDTADAFASIADKWNEIRTVLYNLGLLKGSE